MIPPMPALAVDPSVLVAVVGAVGLIGSSGVGLAVAIVTNRKEKETSAYSSSEATAQKIQDDKDEVIQERLRLRDERIAYLEQQLLETRAELAECVQQHGKKGS